MFSFYIIALYVLLLFIKPIHKFALGLTPWLIFACSYDWMRIIPNYTINDIDIKDLYNAENLLFGINILGHKLNPNEYFALNHNSIADLMAGFFYLCWVPVPLIFGVYLYIKRDIKNYLRFSLAFLLVNLLGFCIYYIHPAAPPWYVMQYGFDPILNTPGNVAGLGRFDELTGIPIFQSLYGKNANVFAALPSLHAAYMLIATTYAVISKQNKTIIVLFSSICIGIWWTAVYSGHHYTIDVISGIIVTIVGIFILEKLLLKDNVLGKYFDKYLEIIS